MPAPGGPVKNRVCPPAAATSIARFAFSWLLIPARSTAPSSSAVPSLGLLKPRGHQRTDSTHVLAAVQALNRLELVRGTMRHALEVLSTVAPDWLVGHADPAWVDRYRGRTDGLRLPEGKPAQAAVANTIGADGQWR